jgi:hypothetical protein
VSARERRQGVRKGVDGGEKQRHILHFRQQSSTPKDEATKGKISEPAKQSPHTAAVTQALPPIMKGIKEQPALK